MRPIRHCCHQSTWASSCRQAGLLLHPTSVPCPPLFPWHCGAYLPTSKVQTPCHHPVFAARVYAFFHEAMPGEPLVVLHTALMHSVPRSMPQVLPPSAAAAATGAAGRLGTSPHDRHAGVTAAQAGPAERTWERMQRQGQPAQPVNQQLGKEGLQGPSVAAFYSISATQPGLAGVDLGNFLIKQASTWPPRNSWALGLAGPPPRQPGRAPLHLLP